MILIIITMYFSGGLIPRYLLISNGLGLRNTLWALILPGAISAWNLIVMRTSFYSIPDSLEESAHVEGANDVTILFRIYLPLSGAVVAVMVLFYGVAIWNAWFDALIFMRDRAKYPLQIILREILIVQSLDSISSSGDVEQIGESIKYATIVVATVPILLVYPFIQRYFVTGVMVGAVKG
jgi:putative aldouronate transport system permease protein